MARLSDSLVKQFVRMTNDTSKKKSESFLYGTVDSIEEDGTVNVIFDGADRSTPCASSVSVAEGDRVLAMLKNRQATITSNISNPTITGDAVFTGILRVISTVDSFNQVVEIAAATDYSAISIREKSDGSSNHDTEINCNYIEMTGKEKWEDQEHFMLLTPALLQFSNDSSSESASLDYFGVTVNGKDSKWATLDSTGVRTSSDARLKRDIKKLSPEQALRLCPVQFHYLDDDAVHYGFIAQDVQTVLPGAVKKEENGYLSINYMELIAPILSLVQNLERRVKELESKCNKELSD